jgi:lipopolysaccharide/colanic/teichoic acid biosynthesis glycosyltransferase
MAARAVPAPVQTRRIRIEAPVPDATAPAAAASGRPVAVHSKPLPVSGAQEAVLAMPAFVPPITLPRTRSRTGALHAKPLYDLAKRVMDVLLATAVLVLGLPIWICVAIAIKLESPGSVLHRGIVYGKSCEPFTYYKFRSMRADGCDAEHRKFIERYVRDNGGHEMNGETVYKLMGDARVTAVGRLIRRLSIDEIPQLINVIRGEMSIVGPRPPLDYEYELYDERAKGRMAVLPGITGLQQVEARHDASFEDKLRIDNEYVRHRSILLDVSILLRTIPAALRGH